MQRELNYKSEKGNVELLVSKDRFSASLKLNEAGIISENEILDLLEKAGINKLLARSELTKNEKKFSEPFIIARTIPESELQVIYLFDQHHSFNPQRTKSLSEFNKLARVTEDIPLAEIKLNKVSPTEQYFDVFGDSVSDADVMERYASRLLTERVYYSREQGKIFSRVKGYPYRLDSGAIAVQNSFVCNENLHKLKMDFYGDLIVNGNIDNCRIMVSGDLIIRGNITNCLGSWIMAQGKLEFDSAENSFIGAGKGIKFSKSARFSLIVSDGLIKGDQQSQVIGGLMKSAEGIQISAAGASVPIKTRLEISIFPYKKEKLKKISSLINRTRKKNNIERNNLTEKQKRLENILEKAYQRVLNDKSFPTIIINKKVHKDTWVKIYNKRKGIFKVASGTVFSSDKHSLRINLS